MARWSELRAVLRAPVRSTNGSEGSTQRLRNRPCLRHLKVGASRNHGVSLFDLSSLTARCGVDLRELWRFCVHGRMTVCYSPCNNFAHAYTP